MLAWRGHQVTIGYLPKLRSPNKPPLADSPGAKEYLAASLAGISSLSGGRIECIELGKDGQDLPIDEEAVLRQAHYDTVMSYQREAVDLEDPSVRKLKEHMLGIGRQAQKIARAYFRNHRYDLHIVGNGTTFEGSQFCRVLVEMGAQVNTTEKFAFRGVRVINHGENFLNGDDINLIWSKRDKLGYTSEPFRGSFIAKARESMRERSMNSTTTWLWELQRAVNQSAAEALKQAGLDQGRDFVLLCPNVVFDAGYGKITDIFPSMKDWMFGTIRFLLDNSDSLVVVRAHPGEGLWWGGREPVHEVLAQQGIRPSDRFLIIPGQAKVNTYHLMERCRFGVVFSSSTGLEMATMGKEVVTGSNVIYTRRGFTRDANDQDEYFRNLGALAGREQIPALSQDMQELALLFYFVYHWVAQYPYPYDKPTSIGRAPPFRLLTEYDMSPYLPYLDLIAMRNDEFEAALPHYLSAERVQERLALTPRRI